MGFLTSKFSGYLSIILLASVIGGGWYMYQRGVTFGELKAAAETLADIKTEQEARRKALEAQAQDLAKGRKQAAELRRKIQDAKDAASEDFNRCFDMPVPDGMRIRQQ